MSLKKIFFKTKFTYNIYLYYNLFVRHKGFKKKSRYSQWGEDQFIIEYFKDHKKGTYLDVGSFHPFMYSNTCLLYNNGWQGINIDINPTTIDLFNIARSRDINICAAVSNKEGIIEYYLPNNNPLSSEITISIFLLSGLFDKRELAHNNASPSIFSLSNPSFSISPKLILDFLEF